MTYWLFMRRLRDLLFEDTPKVREKGVSQVVVATILILMVITVIGVTVYLTVYLEKGAPSLPPPPKPPPRVNLKVTLYDNGAKENDYFTIQHMGGDPLDLHECDIFITGSAGTHLFDPGIVTGLRAVISEGEKKTIRMENTYEIVRGDLYGFVIHHRPTGVCLFHKILTAS